MTQLTRFIPFQKVDDEQRMVYGVATDETPDQQGEIVDYTATKAAVEDWRKWRNVREMHGNSAVGVAEEITLDDAAKTLSIGAKVVDDGAWAKVKAGVYKGFSIGGKKLATLIEKAGGGGKELTRVTEYLLNEISLVDRPANPSAVFSMVKRDSPHPGLLPEGEEGVNKGGDHVSNELEKQATPEKVVKLLQELRNQSELDGDMEGAFALTNAIGLVLQASGDAESADGADESATTNEDQAAEGAPAKGAPAEGAPAEGKSEAKPEKEKPLAMAAVTTTLSKAMGNLVKRDELELSLSKLVKADALADALKKALEGAATGGDLKKLAGDMAKVAQAVDEIGARMDKAETILAGQGPVLRELGFLGTANGAQSEAVLKSVMDGTDDPNLRQLIGAKITEMQIKAAHASGGQTISLR